MVKNEDLPKYQPLKTKAFHVKDRDVLPFSWHKRNYKDMLFTDNPESSSFGDNDGSSIQLYKIIRKPANVFLFRFGDDIPGTNGNIFNDAARLGDINNLDGRLGVELKKEAFVCWGLPNTIHGPSFWVEAVIPKTIVDEFGTTAPADLTTFQGGRFIAIVDPYGGYTEFSVGFPDQFELDLAAITPYIKLFASFNLLVIVDSWNPAIAASEFAGTNDPDLLADYTENLVTLFTNHWELTRTQCTENKALGFEVVEPDYTKILKRIREILK